MIKRGELYVIFDCVRNGKEYFYFSVTATEGHTDGVIKCSEEYSLNLDISSDDVSYLHVLNCLV